MLPLISMEITLTLKDCQQDNFFLHFVVQIRNFNQIYSVLRSFQMFKMKLKTNQKEKLIKYFIILRNELQLYYEKEMKDKLKKYMNSIQKESFQ